MATPSPDIPNDEEEAYVPQFPRDRSVDMATAELSPESLVGSYFRYDHEEDDDFDEGIVVAQVWAGPGQPYVVYLVEFRGQYGVTGYQQTVGLDKMLAQGWKFFDDSGWLTSASVQVREKVQR